MACLLALGLGEGGDGGKGGATIFVQSKVSGLGCERWEGGEGGERANGWGDRCKRMRNSCGF